MIRFVLTAVASASLLSCNAWGQAPKPTLPTRPLTLPVISPNALPVKNSNFNGYGTKEVVVNTDNSKNEMTIKQQSGSNTNIVNWDSFNIGQNSKVFVSQPSSASVLLNNIIGGSSNPTYINGVLKSLEGTTPGRVYIYDPAGIVFGSNSSINLNSLIASSLKFDEARIKAGGLLMPGNDAALRAADGTTPGSIWVNKGANITVENGGQLLLAAPGVFNDGQLSAPDGQVVLAAGNKVYLASPTNDMGTKLRGLLVEVENGDKGSQVENGVSGQVSVSRGNATMVGYAVNQNGIVSAGTSVTLNGSIYLTAKDNTKLKDSSRSGDVVLGASSVTQIAPMDDGTKVTLDQLNQNVPVFNKSEVKITGRNIKLEGSSNDGSGAQIIAKGGLVTVESVNLQANNATPEATSLLKNLVRVDLGTGSRIDVSGMNSAQLDMSSNIISVDLRGNELADNLLLRQSSLYGKKVNIDIRKGTSIANIDGWLKLVDYKLDQVNTEGGKITISSEGAVLQRQGNILNVDGGGVTYLSGYANTSLLKIYNTLTDVSIAKSNVAYSQIINLPDGPRNWETGYTQGSKAGSLSLSGQVVSLQGDLSATTFSPSLNIDKSYQRDVSQKSSIISKISTSFPSGGSLSVTIKGIDPNNDKPVADLYSNLIVGNTSSVVTLPNIDNLFSPESIASINQINLNISDLTKKGFQSISASVNGNIGVNQQLALLPKGALSLDAKEANNSQGNLTINSSINDPGGTINLTAARILKIADSVTINTSGLWTNDSITKSDPIVLNGGSINLQAHQINMGSSVNLQSSAGAWADSWRKVKLGTPGSINFVTLFNDSASRLAIYSGVNLSQSANLSALGFTSGGSLKIDTSNVFIGALSDLNNVEESSGSFNLLLKPDFFQRGGFTKFNIISNQDITLFENTNLNATANSLILNNGVLQKASTNITDVTTVSTLPVAGLGVSRPAASITFNAQGTLMMGLQSSISTDPLSTVKLLAGDQLTVLGSVTAPGGRIVLGLTNDEYTESKNIRLGASAVLNANGGRQKIFTNSSGISNGEILGGGKIEIGGFDTVTESLTPANAMVITESGSNILVNGYVGTLKLNLLNSLGVNSTTLSSNAGSIDIQSRQGLLLAANMSGKSDLNSQGGTLKISLSTGDYIQGDPIDELTGQPNPRIINLINTGVAKDLLTLSNKSNGGEGWIDLSSFSAGGFGRLQFKAQDALAFNLGSKSSKLSALDSIILDSPVIRANRDLNLVKLSAAPVTDAIARDQLTLSLEAPSVQMGGLAQQLKEYEENVFDKPYFAPSPKIGSAVFNVSAKTLDLVGVTSLQGFKLANLTSVEDTRLTSINSKFLSLDDKTNVERNPENLKSMPGLFAMQGDLIFKNAQIYTTTLSDFKISVQSDENSKYGNLLFTSNGNRVNPVYSAGGSLVAVAPHILQSGVVKAPLGQITLGQIEVNDLTFTKDLTYAANSITSVKGEVEMLYGSVSNGSVPSASVWSLSIPGAYGYLASLLLDGANLSTLYKKSLPNKQLISIAKDVIVDSSSILDASAGGQLIAYEFTPGGGGSKDFLNKDNTFAILPGYQSSTSPIDPNNFDSSLKVGSKIYLSASQGLAAGVYTLLPSHYALLPGGFSVQIQNNTSGMAAKSNQVLSDGTALVSGSLLSSNQSSGNLYGFQIASGDLIRKKSEYSFYNANDFFAQQAQINLLPTPQMPNQSGYVQLLANNTLSLNGEIKLGNGLLDISLLGGDLAIASNASTQKNTLSAQLLSNIQASSLIIGGVRTVVFDESGQSIYQITNLSKSVVLENDLTHPLIAKDISLVATDFIELKSGSNLISVGKPLFNVSQFSISGDGALIRVSGSSSVDVSRSNVQGSKGTLKVSNTANILTNEALFLDATYGMQLANALPIVQGYLGIASNGISIGINADTSTTGLSLNANTFESSKLKELSLSTYNQKPIQFDGVVSIGQIDINDSPTLGKLSIKASGLSALSDSTNVTLNSKVIQINGGNFKVDSESLNNLFNKSDSTLNINSDEILVGNGQFLVKEFATNNWYATKQIRATGDQGVFVYTGDLNLKSNEITAETIKSAHFISRGVINLEKSGSLLNESLYMGGELAFTAKNILTNADIRVPSGRILFNDAKDRNLIDSTGDISISGGLVSVAGANKSFGIDASGKELWAYAPAGSIELNGNKITLQDGTIDLSSKGASAGSLAIQALDEFILNSTKFNGKSIYPLQSQGQFSLQTTRLTDFSTLNNKIRDAGFNESVSYRLTDGDINISSTDRIVAKNITLSADNGNVMVDGILDATGSIGGVISIFASQPKAGNAKGSIYIQNNALLNTSSTQLDSNLTADPNLSITVNWGKGGQVLLSTSTWDGSSPASIEGGSSVYLQGGEIRAKGKSDDLNGTVSIRVPRTQDNVNLAIYSNFQTKLTNTKPLAVEGFKVYEYQNIDETALSKLFDEAKVFSNSINFPESVRVRPGIEIRSDSLSTNKNLSISVNENDSNPTLRGWDLSSWRFGPIGNQQPINLTLRSEGNLFINGSISDGFIKPVEGSQRWGMSMPNWKLGSGASADITLIAGADLKSANTLATKQLVGDFVLDFSNRTADSSTNAPVTINDMPVALVRTGTGNIKVAAGRDVILKLMSLNQLADSEHNIKVFDNQIKLDVDSNPLSLKHSVTVVGASIYTAGEVDSDNLQPPMNLLNLHYVGKLNKSKLNSELFSNSDFTKNGGSISIHSGRSVFGPVASNVKNWYIKNNDFSPASVEIETFYAEDLGGKSNAQKEANLLVKNNLLDKVNYISSIVVLKNDADYGDYYEVTSVLNNEYQHTEDWLPTSVSPLVNTWLFRQGRSNFNADGSPVFVSLQNNSLPNVNTLTTAWWTRPDYFNQSVATLGGGDLLIKAGGEIKNIYASTATNAYMTESSGNFNLKQNGGGDLTISAKGDISGVALYVQKGLATVMTNGSVSAGDNFVFSQDSSGFHSKVNGVDGRNSLQSLFALGDAKLNLLALKNVSIGAIYNPMIVEQNIFNRTGVNDNVRLDGESFFNRNINQNLDLALRYPVTSKIAYFSPAYENSIYWDPANKYGSDTLKITSTDYAQYQRDYSQFSNFITYSSLSSFSSMSLGGSISLVNDYRPIAWSDQNLVMNDLTKVSNLGFDRLYTLAPGTLQVTSMNAKVNSQNGFVLAPSNQGQISLWALNNVALNNGISGVKGAIYMLDLNPTSMSSVDAPRVFNKDDLKIITDSSKSDLSTHSKLTLHTDDFQSASIVSLKGDVIGDSNYALATFNLPKATTILAGRDILNLGFMIQNNNYYDISLLKAGRDIKDETIQAVDCTATGGNCLQHLLTGPGQLKVIAGRDIDLGNQSGVVTKGNSSNPFLPFGGASIQMSTGGLIPDYKSLNEFLNSSAVVGIFKSSIIKNWNDAYSASNLNELNKLFFQLLNESSKFKDGTTKALNLTYFDGVINAMNINIDSLGVGNLSSHSSQIKTEQGGSIDLFAPTGSIFAGLTMGPVVSSPANQGIFTIREGDVRAFVKNQFLVNQGRVFTLSGGDITLVSQFGNLEAGKGAKTASSAPPPLITIDTNGNVKVDVSSSISGSGIATLSTHPGQQPSSVFAIAPRGYFDAGDAGVRSTGSVEINAPIVRNADNITATGAISNSQAPTVASPAIASVAPPASTSTTGDDLKKSIASTSNSTTNTNLSVELLGLGDGKSDGLTAPAENQINLSVQVDTEKEEDKELEKEK